MDVFLILALVFSALWGGHWMPWFVSRALVDEHGLLHRPLAYCYGCACIIGGFALWALSRSTDLVSPLEALWFLMADVAAAGAGTMLPRLITFVLDHRNLKEDVEDYEQAVRQGNTAPGGDRGRGRDD